MMLTRQNHSKILCPTYPYHQVICESMYLTLPAHHRKGTHLGRKETKKEALDKTDCIWPLISTINVLSMLELVLNFQVWKDQTVKMIYLSCKIPKLLILLYTKFLKELCVVAYACNPSAQHSERGGVRDWGQHTLRMCLKNKKKRQSKLISQLIRTRWATWYLWFSTLLAVNHSLIPSVVLWSACWVKMLLLGLERWLRG